MNRLLEEKPIHFEAASRGVQGSEGGRHKLMPLCQGHTWVFHLARVLLSTEPWVGW